MENMLQNLYNDLLKDQNLDYSKATFFQLKVSGWPICKRIIPILPQTEPYNFISLSLCFVIKNQQNLGYWIWHKQLISGD